ncbi:MAG: homocysteine S-methyltransferase family protein, partial [Steroidobacterales bacterium]
INLTSIMPKTSDGCDFASACKELADNGALVVGLNCGRGPPTLLPILKKVLKSVGEAAHVAAIPVTYRTNAKSPGFFTLHHPGCRHGFPVELDPFILTRYEMADFAVTARKLGAKMIGVCCGGAPHHLRAMAEALGRKVPASAYSPDLKRHAVMGEGEFARSKDRKRYSPERKKMRAKG